MRDRSLTFFSIIFSSLLTFAFILPAPVGAATTSSVTITGTVPLVVYDVTSGGISQTTSTVVWKTNGNANSTVEYGTTAAYSWYVTDGLMQKGHSITLSGLSAGTLYHYRVVSRDLLGNVATSPDATFMTQVPPTPVPVPTRNPINGGDSDSGGGGRSIFTEIGQILQQLSPPEQPGPEEPSPFISNPDSQPPQYSPPEEPITSPTAPVKTSPWYQWLFAPWIVLPLLLLLLLVVLAGIATWREWQEHTKRKAQKKP